MLRLLLFDLTRRFAPDARRLHAAALADLGTVPPELRTDIGLSDARLADAAWAQAQRTIAARRADEGQRLLGVLDRIARRRGFPGLRWRTQQAR